MNNNLFYGKKKKTLLGTKNISKIFASGQNFARIWFSTIISDLVQHRRAQSCFKLKKTLHESSVLLNPSVPSPPPVTCEPGNNMQILKLKNLILISNPHCCCISVLTEQLYNLLCINSLYPTVKQIPCVTLFIIYRVSQNTVSILFWQFEGVTLRQDLHKLGIGVITLELSSECHT